jgi:hypothetical protein
MGMAVDEPGRHDQAVGIDNTPGRVADAADGNNPLVGNPYIGGESLRSRSIDHRATLYQKVQHSTPSNRPTRKRHDLGLEKRDNATALKAGLRRSAISATPRANSERRCSPC